VRKQLAEISQNVCVNTSKGKRAAPRSTEPTRPKLTLSALWPALFATTTLVAWGLLVYLAVGYGERVRNGSTSAWAMLLLTGLAAVVCLFVTFIMLARMLQALGSAGLEAGPDKESRPVGGRRAKR
jgi:hypothetical protein